MKDIHEYPWPDPSRVDVSELRSEADKWRNQYAILGGDWSPFWHDAIDLVGMENLYLKMEGDTPEFVRQQTLQVLSIMAPGGGYIAGASHDSILEETPVENVLAMFDAVEEFSGVWERSKRGEMDNLSRPIM